MSVGDVIVDYSRKPGKTKVKIVFHRETTTDGREILYLSPLNGGGTGDVETITYNQEG